MTWRPGGTHTAVMATVEIVVTKVLTAMEKVCGAELYPELVSVADTSKL